MVKTVFNLIRTGCTVTPGRKAPVRKVMRQERLVQVPSGNISTCCQSPSGSLRSTICLIVFCRELGSSLNNKYRYRMVQDKAEKRDRIYTTVNSKDISKRRIIKHHSDEKKTSAADPDPYPTTGLKCCTEQRSRMEKN